MIRVDVTLRMEATLSDEDVQHYVGEYFEGAKVVEIRRVPEGYRVLFEVEEP